MENFIQAKLRIITWEQPLRKLQELFWPLEVKAQLQKFFDTGACTLNDVLLTYTIQICKYKVMGCVTPYKIKMECYLLRSCLMGAGRMLCFIVEEVWWMHNADTQCTLEGREEAKGQRKIFYV